MNIKEVLNSKVLDKNAYEVGTVSDFDFDQKEGTIKSMVVSLKKGVFSKEELEVAFEDIETIGGYVILSKELPEAEETEEEVEVQKEVKVSNIYKITHNFRENIQSIQVFVEVIGKLADEHDNNVINDCFNPLEETYKKLKTEFFSSIKKDENEEDSLSEAEKQELMKYWVKKLSVISSVR